ncbi:MAG: uracil-DNA glycosylase [Candidatus Nitrosocaldus sp.]|nr:uracil-DNA glycosylase [Candidatus Nitrosocaldus sp.]
MDSLYDASGDSISKVADEVRICKRCRLSHYRSNAVPGEGAESARLVFIGEAPGRMEDTLGRPFVGSAGRVLEYALARAGIDRTSVYITNIVKCRPPMNRRPRRDEIDSCIPYIIREIMLINPKVICLLGRTAHDTLLKGSFREHRSRYVKHDGRLFFTTYHPAYVIYNNKLKDMFVSDIISIKRMVDAMN